MENNDCKIIGVRLKEFRNQRNMSLEALGELLGVAGSQIFKYESGANMISLDKLIFICNKFDIDIEFFIGDLVEKSKDEYRAAYIHIVKEIIKHNKT